MLTPPPKAESNSKSKTDQQQQQPNLGEALSELHLGARIAPRSPVRKATPGAAAAAAAPSRPLSVSFEEGATPPPPPPLDLGEPGTAPAALANRRTTAAAAAAATGSRPKTRAALAKAVATALPPSSSSEAGGGSGSDGGGSSGSDAGEASGVAAARRRRRAAAAAAAGSQGSSSSSRLRPRQALATEEATAAAKEESVAAAVAAAVHPVPIPAAEPAVAAAAATALPEAAKEVEDDERRRKKEASTAATSTVASDSDAATALTTAVIPHPPPETRLSLPPSKPSLSDQAVGLCYDPGMELHVPPGPHVERPARTATLAALLVKMGLAERCRAVAPRPASDSELIRAHSREHVKKVDGYFELVAGKMRDANAAALTRAQAAAARGGGAAPSSSGSSSSSADRTNDLVPFESGDMFWSPGTASAARLAAGCVTQAALSVLSGEARRAFAVVRPPGHHAECARAQGFCFYNNVALAALAAIEAGAKRVLVVDWDVHHGERDFSSFLFFRYSREIGVSHLSTSTNKKITPKKF